MEPRARGWRWPAAVVAVVAVGFVWGLFLSPKAALPVPGIAALGIEIALFVGTGVGLVAIGFAVPAGIGIAIWLIDRIALAVLQR